MDELRYPVLRRQILFCVSRRAAPCRRPTNHPIHAERGHCRTSIRHPPICIHIWTQLSFFAIFSPLFMCCCLVRESALILRRARALGTSSFCWLLRVTLHKGFETESSQQLPRSLYPKSVELSGSILLDNFDVLITVTRQLQTKNTPSIRIGYTRPRSLSRAL